MSYNQNVKDLRLLPNYFKKIAFGLIFASFLLAILSKTKILPFDKETIKMVSMNVMLISFLILAMARDKIEDELTMKIRINAFAASFLFAVIFVLVQPFISIIFYGSFISNKIDKGSTHLIFLMFFIYFYIFYIGKKKR